MAAHGEQRATLIDRHSYRSPAGRDRAGAARARQRGRQGAGVRGVRAGRGLRPSREHRRQRRGDGRARPRAPRGEARRALRLEALDWDPEGKTLTFAIRAGAAIDAATLVFAGAASSASVDGEPLPVTHREREGRQQSALVTDLPRAELRRFVVSWV